MKRAASLALLPLLLLAGPAPAGEEPKQADAALRKLVNDAIERGAKWLAGERQPGGTFPSIYGMGHTTGPTALATLALLHSGIPKDDPGVAESMAFLHRHWNEARQTYAVSVLVMLLAEYGRGRNGHPFALEDADLSWMQEMVDWLVEVQEPAGGWRYPGGGVDMSNTQYALLALKEARKSGLRVPEETFGRALGVVLASQEGSGTRVARYQETRGDGAYGAMRERVPGYDRVRGFGYMLRQPPTGSMTAAGVAAAAICASELKAEKVRALAEDGVQAARDGLAWLGKHFDVTLNPRSGPMWHYYYLYGLERAGMLAGVVYVGEHRWYPEGAKYLVDAQRPDGSWRPAMAVPGRGPNSGDAIDQSFALLFLTRATARALGVPTEQPLLDLTGGEKLSERDFATLLDAAFAELEGLPEARRPDRARDFALLGPRVLPLLIARLLDAEEGTRALADSVLRAVTGLSFDYDAAAPAEEREAAADAWTLWYLRNRERLGTDPAERRIR
ncbi:MAG: hypothetical protein MUE73_07495 [Planctomycetes bacterium]|nr:hypothetical protein [Planctomycetota bacterium]